jgi:hypothetical protein
LSRETLDLQALGRQGLILILILILSEQVGNEFGAVEALWSQFEGVMASKEDGNQEGSQGRRDDEEEGDGAGDSFTQAEKEAK